MMPPVSVLGGGAEERIGAGELNKSAGEGKVEMMFRPQNAVTQIHLEKLLFFFFFYHNASAAVAVHAVHAGIGNR